MPYPVILVNSATGSDTAASGAGPSTALSGTKARTRNEANSLHVGFFESSPPDLSGVLTDGSHALFVNTASGRAFCRISGKKDTQQSGNDAAINSGNNQVTVGSTTGISVDDVIKIEGAGVSGADFYQRVSAVNSSTLLTLYSTASTTVSGANWVCPKKVVVVGGLNTADVDCDWAIGGKRATIDNANTRKLFSNTGGGDIEAGWVIEIEDDQTVTSTITVNRNSTSNATPVWVRGADPNNRPIITHTANTALFTNVAGYGNQWFSNLELRNSNATKTASYGFYLPAVTIVKNCKIGHEGEGFYQGVFLTSNSQSVRLMDCEICYNASHGANTGTGTCTINGYNCYVHHNGGFGLYINFGSFNNCMVAYNGSYGIYYHTASPSLSKCIVTHNGSHGVATAAFQYGPFVINSQFTYNGAWGFAFGTTQTNAEILILNCNFYGNTSGGYTGVTLDSSNLTLDPQYSDDVNGDFTVNNPLLLQTGWPDSSKGGMNTPNKADIGFDIYNPTAEEIAEAIWEYGERTLTS